MSDVEEIVALIATKKRRLGILKQKEARMGPNLPPEDLMDIQDIETHIRELERQADETKKPPGLPPAAVTMPPHSSLVVDPGRKDTRASPRLRVFLAHAAEDKDQVRRAYGQLLAEGIEPWLDEEDLVGGAEWEREISKAVSAADAVLVFLSTRAVTKAGYVQKEIKLALDVAERQPENTIFLIPVRLESCKVPERLVSRQWIDLYEHQGWEKLLHALRRRAKDVGATPPAQVVSANQPQEELTDRLAQSILYYISLAGEMGLTKEQIVNGLACDEIEAEDLLETPSQEIEQHGDKWNFRKESLKSKREQLVNAILSDIQGWDKYTTWNDHQTLSFCPIAGTMRGENIFKHIYLKLIRGNYQTTKLDLAIENLENMLESLRNSRLMHKGLHSKTEIIAISNIVALLSLLKNNDLSFGDLSHLTVENIDFQEIRLHDVYAHSAQFKNCSFRRTFGSISSLTVSPDRKFVAMGATNGVIRVWNPHDPGKDEFFEKVHQDTVRSIEFVNLIDDRIGLLTAGEDGKIYLLKIMDDKGNFSRSGTVDLILDLLSDNSENKRIRALCAKISPDGSLIFVGTEGGVLKCIDFSTREIVTKKPYDDKDWLISINFMKLDVDSRDEDASPWTLITGSQDGKITTWSVNRLDAGQVQLDVDSEIEFGDRLKTILTYENTVIAGGEDSVIRVFAMERLGALSTPKLVKVHERSIRERGTGRIWNLALNPSATFLAVAADDGVLRVFDLQALVKGDSRKPASGRGHKDRIWSVVFLDNNTLITGDDAQMVREWVLKTEGKGPLLTETIDKVVQGYSNRIWTVAAYPIAGKDTSHWLAYAGDFRDVAGDPRKRVQIFHRLHSRHISLPERTKDAVPEGRVEALTWNKDGTALAIAGHDGIFIWDDLTLTDDKSPEFKGSYRVPLDPNDWSYTVAWHPDGRLLAYGTREGSVAVWRRTEDQANPLRETLVIHRPAKAVRSICFSHDGAVLCAATEGGQILWWGRSGVGFSAVNPREIDVSTKPVRAVAFCPNNGVHSYVIVSGDDTGTIALWAIDFADEAKVQQLQKHPMLEADSLSDRYHSERIRSIAFSPDGHLMASGDDDGKVILWSVELSEGTPSLRSLGVLRQRLDERQRNTHKTRIRSLSFFADGDLATCCEAESEAITVWKYRYKYGSNIALNSITSAYAIFDKFSTFHAPRIYEGLALNDTDFHQIQAKDPNSSQIVAQLEYLGAFKGRIKEIETQRRMRIEIRNAVVTLYGHSELNETRWAANTARLIQKEMEDYLRLSKPRRGSEEARADWAAKLGDYERRLRILLDEQRPDCWILRSNREEEDVARFLLRICFVLRRKDQRDNRDNENLKLSNSDLEEVLLSSFPRGDSSSSKTIWATNRYYTWPFVWSTIAPNGTEELPEDWSEPTKNKDGRQNEHAEKKPRSRFGKAISQRFLEIDAPFEPEFDPQDYIYFFDGGGIKFDKPNGTTDNKESVGIACTIEDDSLRDPDSIIYIHDSQNFQFSESSLEEHRNWLGLEDDKDETKARIKSIHKDKVSDQLHIILQPVKYSYYCVTNLPISLSMKYLDQGKYGNRTNVLDWLCPIDEQDGIRKLPNLETCQLSNHLGVDCIVITKDGYLLMYRRLQNEMTDPNTIGFTPSIAMYYYIDEKNKDKDLETHTPQSAIKEAFSHELGKSASLDEIHEGFLYTGAISRSMLYLGTFREWARGGKPEMYFLTRSSLSLQEHKKRLPESSASGQTRLAPRKKDLQESKDFKLCDGDFSSMLDYRDVQRRLWRLVNDRKAVLQESAKAGIYLLSKAYETEPEKLLAFFAQFESQA